MGGISMRPNRGMWTDRAIAYSTSRSGYFSFLIVVGLLVGSDDGRAQTSVNPSASKSINQRNTVGLNPQPEPPSRAKIKKVKPVEMRGLNPQPEPPKPPN